MLIIAQTPGNVGLLAALLLAFLSLVVGGLVGYGLAYRYKRRYLIAAKQIANSQGQNFRGELTTIGGIGGPAPSTGQPPVNRESLASSELCGQCQQLEIEKEQLVSQLEQQRADAQQQLERIADLERQDVAQPTTAVDSTESWQLAQLHREQIAMQLKMDEFVNEISRLTSERDEALRRIPS